MPKFTVTIERSAVETAYLEVAARDADAAEDKINKVLNRRSRVDLDDLAKIRGVKVTDTDCNGDGESSWEIGEVM